MMMVMMIPKAMAYNAFEVVMTQLLKSIILNQSFANAVDVLHLVLP